VAWAWATSSATAVMRPSPSFTSASSIATRRPAANTVTPCLAYHSASARPMPLLAPVISAVFIGSPR
jgi:hypothetical protein